MIRLLTLTLALLLLGMHPVVTAQDAHDHDHEDDHALVEDDQHDHDDHTGHDHAEHGDEVVIELTEDAIAMAGIAMSRARHGRIDKVIDLPGEVGFNEDRLVHIAPRFPGLAVKAFFRVGDYVNEGDEVAIVESNESLNPYSIISPISGSVIERHITTGEFVSGENSIYVIADLSTVWVNVAVYPKDADAVATGMKIHLKAMGSDVTADGTIDYVTPVVDVNTRSITARVVLPNPNNRWRPGTFVKAQVSDGTGDEGLVVEKSAVQILDDQSVVFVGDGPGRFRPVEVTTGDGNSRYVRILSGLIEGDQYVAKGAFELKAEIVTGNLGAHAGHGH